MAPSPEIAPIVQTLNDVITKEFLLSALKSLGFSDINYYKVTYGTKPGDNHLSIIYALELKKSQQNSKIHLLLKCYPNHPGRQLYSNKCNMFFKELEFYSKWIPELERFQSKVLGLNEKCALKLPFAKFIYGECIDFDSAAGSSRRKTKIHPLENFIMLQDLKKTFGFKMTNRTKCLDFEHMLLVIKALANIHAISWAYRYHVEKNVTKKFSCLVPNYGEEEMAAWEHVMLEILNQVVKILDSDFGLGNIYSLAMEKFKLKYPKVMGFVNEKVKEKELESLLRLKPDPERFGRDAEHPEPWRVISHNDSWSNNFLFRYDPVTSKPIEVVLVDHQVAKESCVVNDLVFVIYACADRSLRHKHLNTLLSVYHDHFNSCCNLMKSPTLPGFCMDSLKYRFHRSKIVGFLLANTILPMMMKEDGNQLNWEEMDHSLSAEEGLMDIFGSIGGNEDYKKRLVELIKDMIDDGVL